MDLRAARERFEVDAEQPTPFICECGNVECRQIIRLTLADYERVRADPNTFFVVPGHDDPATEQIVTGEVLHRNERFAVVKKRGEFRKVTEGTDPR